MVGGVGGTALASYAEPPSRSTLGGERGSRGESIPWGILARGEATRRSPLALIWMAHETGEGLSSKAVPESLHPLLRCTMPAFSTPLRDFLPARGARSNPMP